MENYTTVHELGKGACGAVYLVRQNESNKLYALKKIQMDERRKNRTKSAVMREAKILATLKHPNIVAYHDSFFDEDQCYIYIVQDYCDGGSLDDKIEDTTRKKEFLPEKQVMRWFIQITMAVQYMHSQRILHRDIKAQNVFMNKSGTTCRIGDFGISKMMETTIDMASTCVGTPCYLAPEMCQDKPYSSKADVWVEHLQLFQALGCLLFEMCALRPAFDANNLISLFYKIAKADVEPIPSLYSPRMMELVRSVLVKSPEDRPSARQILQLDYVKEQVSEFIIELMTISELREKESPHRTKKTKSGKSPLVLSRSNSAEMIASPDSRRRKQKTTDKTSLSQTFDSAIKLDLPLTPRSSREIKHVCDVCGKCFTLRSWLTKHIEKKHTEDYPVLPSPCPQVSKHSPVQCVHPATKQRSAQIEGAGGDQEYEDDFEDSEEDEGQDIPEEVAEDSGADNQSDPEDYDYADDFEEYASDENLDNIVHHCRELHEGEDHSEDDEVIMDEEPSSFVASCKSLLQEHAIQTLGKTKYKEIRDKGKLSDITEEDLSLQVKHRSGHEHLETCFLVSEFLTDNTP